MRTNILAENSISVRGSLSHIPEHAGSGWPQSLRPSILLILGQGVGNHTQNERPPLAVQHSHHHQQQPSPSPPPSPPLYIYIYTHREHLHQHYTKLTTCYVCICRCIFVSAYLLVSNMLLPGVLHFHCLRGDRRRHHRHGHHYACRLLGVSLLWHALAS